MKVGSVVTCSVKGRVRSFGLLCVNQTYPIEERFDFSQESFCQTWPTRRPRATKVVP